MLKKTLFTALAASMILCLAVPAMAEEKNNTYTTPDGILSIELPAENWTALQDPSKWVALSDGSNMITIEHSDPGGRLSLCQHPDGRIYDS